METPYIEKECTIEHEGQTFESGGAVITDSYVIGYMSSDMRQVTTWHGEVISENVRVTAKWPIRSYVSSHMYQVRAFINGKWFTGRTVGEGMIIRMRPAK